MSDFKTLSQTFQALVRRSTADVQGGNAHSGGDKDTGFAEAQTQFEGLASSQEIAIAEKKCLDFKAQDNDELLLKVDFLLSQLRTLSQETEEFDELADILRHDLATFLKK
jgi:hypothetical protein